MKTRFNNFRVSTFGAAVCFLIAAAAATGDGPAEQPAKYSLDRTGLKKLAADLMANPKLLRQLRPRYGQCRAIAADQDVAFRVWRHAERFYANAPQGGIGAPKNATIHAAAMSVSPRPGPLAKDQPKDEFTSRNLSLVRFAKKLSPDASFHALMFKEPGEDGGPVLAGFAAVKGRWVLVPKIDRVLADERDHDIRLDILRMFSSKYYDDLYDLTGSGITERVARSDFPDFVRQLGVGEIKDLKWQRRGFKAQNDATFYNNGATVVFADGRTGDLNLILAREAGELKVAWLGLRTKLGLDPPFLYTPPPAKCRALAKDFAVKLVAGLASEDFTSIHESAADVIKNKYTPDQLLGLFGQLTPIAGDLQFVKEGRVVLRSPPVLGQADGFRGKYLSLTPEEQKAPTGPLEVRGWVRDAVAEKQAEFTFYFRYEKDTWKPSGFTLNRPQDYKPKADAKKQAVAARNAARRAATLAQAGNYKQALAAVNEALENGLGEVPIHLLKGRILNELGELRRAAISFTNVLHLNEDHHAARSARAKVFLADKEFENAIDDASYLIRRQVPMYDVRAAAHYGKKDYEAALRDYSTIIDEERTPPDEPDVNAIAFANYMRGVILLDLQAYDLAAALFAQSVKLAPDDQKIKDAVADKQRRMTAELAARKKDPDAGRDKADANHKQGLELAEAYRHAKAIGWFSKAIHPKHKRQPEIVWLRANSLFKLGVSDLAMREFERAFELGFDRPGSRETLGLLHVKAGRFRDAVDDFTFEINKGSKKRDVWTERALAYDQLGEFKKSLADFQTALTMSKVDARALEGRATVQRKLAVQAVLSQTGQEAAAAFVELADPSLRKYLHVPSLQQRFATIHARFGKPKPGPWREFEEHKLTGGVHLSAKIGFDKGEAACEFVYGPAGKLLGLHVKADQFSLDTFDAVHNTGEYEANAKKFLELIYADKGDEAFKLFSRNAVGRGTFNGFVPFRDAAGKVGVAEIQHHATRIKAPSDGKNILLQVYHLVVLKDGRSSAARTVYELHEGKFLPASFQAGNFSDEYPLHRYALQERFFAALASKNADKLLELVSPADRRHVNRAVLQAYLNKLGDSLGPFRSIEATRFAARTEYAGNERRTDAKGIVHFEKGPVSAECGHRSAMLQSFNLPGIGDKTKGWTRGISDTKAFEQEAKAFLTELAGGKPAKAHEILADNGFEVPVKHLIDQQKMFQNKIGVLKQVRFDSKEHLPDADRWKFHYTLIGEKGNTSGGVVNVVYGFHAFGGGMYQYTVDLDKKK